VALAFLEDDNGQSTWVFEIGGAGAALLGSDINVQELFTRSAGALAGALCCLVLQAPSLARITVAIPMSGM